MQHDAVGQDMFAQRHMRRGAQREAASTPDRDSTLHNHKLDNKYKTSTRPTVQLWVSKMEIEPRNSSVSLETVPTDRLYSP
jgi:hypothetical protein